MKGLLVGALSLLAMAADIPYERLVSPVTACAAPVVEPNDELPEWLHIAPYGQYKGHYMGEFEITDFELDAIINNFKRQGIDTVVDLDHQTLWARDNGQPAPAQAWIDKLEKRENGLWGHVRYYTPQGAERLRNREYRYISPVFIWMAYDRKSGNPTGADLHSVAFTNTPFLAGDITPVVNQENPGMLNILSVLSLLSLAANATEDDIKKLAVDAALGKAAREKLWPNGTLPTDAQTKVRDALDHKGFVSMAEHLAALNEAGLREQQFDADQLVAGARAAGKLTPATEGAWRGWFAKDPKAAANYLGAQPPVVPTKPIPTGGANPDADASALSETELKVCKQLELTPMQFMKAKKLEAK